MGSPSKEYLERVRSHNVLVVSHVSSYDVSNNPTVTEGESMQSVKCNRHTLEEQWSHSSSGGADEVRVVNEWSSGLKPTVSQKAMQVNSEAAAEGGDGKDSEKIWHERF